MIYGSVCSGIESASVAWHPLGWQPRFFAEIEKFPMPGEALAQNGVPNYGDFTKIEAAAGPVDLLVGGTPCQSFSVAGKRLGLDDPRGNLALEYLALARRLGARWIVWENVPGVLSSKSAATGDGDGECGESRDFATFLDFVLECGYGFAYRVVDAQFTRVDGYERAVPQRRRRVFLVGYLGDWRPAAAVLLEPEGLRGNPAPRREAGKGIAPTISARPSGGGGLGTDFDLDGGLIAADVASTLNAAFGSKMGLEDQHINSGTPLFVAHALRGEGFDASEDGTGRGTPIVPAAFSYKDLGADSADGVSPTLRSLGAYDANGGGQMAVAFDMRGREGGAMPEGPHDTANIRAASGGSSRSYVAQPFSIMPMNSGKDYKARETDVAQPIMAGGPVGGNQGGDFIAHDLAVRRLTPTECERLQGFPDGWTAIPGAADGPRYKALGNSMAVNVMRAIGKRIDLMEGLIRDGKVVPGGQP